MKRVLLKMLKRLFGLTVVGLFVTLSYYSVLRQMETPSYDEYIGRKWDIHHS